jgi:hypothetical protein
VEEGPRGEARHVDEDLMIQVVADWTGIPLSRMEKKESEKLLNLEAEIQKTVVGQGVAAGAIAGAPPLARGPEGPAPRSARSSSSARPASARPRPPSSSPRRCSATRTRSSRST